MSLQAMEGRKVAAEGADADYTRNEIETMTMNMLGWNEMKP